MDNPLTDLSSEVTDELLGQALTHMNHLLHEPDTRQRVVGMLFGALLGENT
jgi:hypothetical protein